MIWIPTGNLLPSERSSNPAGMVMAGKPVQDGKLHYPLLVAPRKACMILVSIVTTLIENMKAHPTIGRQFVKSTAR